MAIERRRYGPAPSPSSSTSLADLVDRILDKGLVIDAWVRISLVGIELATIEARIVVASVDTYLKYAEAIAQTALAAEPHAYRRAVQAAPSDDEVAAYLNDHAEGVGLDDVARFFDVSREELKPVLQRLTTGPRVRVDHGRLIPTDASNGSNGSRRQGKLSARVTDDGDGAGADDAAETEDDSDEAKDRAKDRSHAAKQRR